MTAFNPMPSAGDGIGPNTNNTGDWSPWLRDVVRRLDIRADRYNIFDPIYEGPSGPAGIGNADADTYALNACIADVYSGGSPGVNGKEKLIRGRGGKALYLNTQVQWPEGVHLYGGAGSEGVTGRPFTIKWNGTPGGDMFRSVAVGGRVNNMLISECVFREGTARPGRLWIIGDETTVPVSGLDFGTRFVNTHFYNFDGYAVDARVGPTNFSVDYWRADNFPGAVFRIAVNNAASEVHIGHWTADNVSSGGRLIDLDNAGMGSNKSVSVHIHDGKFEINSALTGEKTLVLAAMDPTASQGIAHRIRLDDVQIALGGGVSADYSIVGARRTDAVLTRMIEVEATKMTHGPGTVGRLIDGVVDPHNLGAFTGKVPNWSYTPQGFGFATPGGEGVFNDFQTQTRFRDLYVGNGSYTDLAGSGGGRGMIHIHDRLAAPSGNPVGGVHLYSEAGVLKWKDPAGVVHTLP